MATINSTEIKRNALLEIDGAPWLVLETNTHTPSARGASSIIKTKVKNLLTGQVLSKSFRGGDTVELADYEKRKAQFLYQQQDDYFFMDQESYDQFPLSGESLGDGAGYLTDGLEVVAMLYNGDVISVELPQVVELEVVDTAPALKNATAQAQTKPAKLETGIEIQVPPYLKTGERIRVDTRDGRFVGRATGS